MGDDGRDGGDLGVAAILSAVAYTGGPFPLGYYGLGDLFVFIFFGLAATTGTYYILVASISTAAWMMGIAMGLLIVNILVVNNLRDIDNDREAGKKTLAVRMGVDGSRLEYLVCIIGAFFIPVLLWATGKIPVYAISVLFIVPMGIDLVRSVQKDEGRKLNLTLTKTGQFALIYSLIFSLGILIWQISPIN